MTVPAPLLSPVLVHAARIVTDDFVCHPSRSEGSLFQHLSEAKDPISACDSIARCLRQTECERVEEHGFSRALVVLRWTGFSPGHETSHSGFRAHSLRRR